LNLSRKPNQESGHPNVGSRPLHHELISPLFVDSELVILDLPQLPLSPQKRLHDLLQNPPPNLPKNLPNEPPKTPKPTRPSEQEPDQVEELVSSPEDTSVNVKGKAPTKQVPIQVPVETLNVKPSTKRASSERKATPE